MDNPTQLLLADIVRFLQRNEMAPSVFGLDAVNDRGFVRDLRAGREPRFGTAQRVRDFMVQYESERVA